MFARVLGMAIVYGVSLVGEISKRLDKPAADELERFERQARLIANDLRPSAGSAGVSGRAPATE